MIVPSDSLHGLAVLADAAVKGTVVLAIAAGMSVALRRASASARHMVWLLAVVSLIGLPVLSAVLPAWQVPLVPRWTPQAPPSEPVVIQAPVRTVAEPVTAEPAVTVAEPAPSTPRWTVNVQLAEPAAVDRVTAPMAEPPAPEPVAVAVPAHVQPPPVAQPRPVWPVMVCWIWIAGAGLMLLRLAVGTLNIWRLSRHAREMATGPWQLHLEEICLKLGIERPVRLLQASRATMPVTWGLWRPVVLLPAEADRWPEERIRIVLLHELSHVKRMDWLTQLVGRVACSLYWFNPLLWWALRQLRLERERACDDLVLAAGSRPSDYAECLLEMVRTLHTPICGSVAAVPMARRPRFERRLRAILSPRRNRRRVTRLAALVALAVAACLTLPLAAMRAADALAPPSGAATEAGASPSENTPVEPAPATQAEPSVTLVYPIADIVAENRASPMRDFGNLRDGTVVRPHRSKADRHTPEMNKSIREQSLADLIRTHVEPTAWEGAGGRGTIVAFRPNQTLVIATTMAVHEKVAELLAQIRRQSDVIIHIKVSPVRASVDLDQACRRMLEDELGVALRLDAASLAMQARLTADQAEQFVAFVKGRQPGALVWERPIHLLNGKEAKVTELGHRPTVVGFRSRKVSVVNKDGTRSEQNVLAPEVERIPKGLTMNLAGQHTPDYRQVIIRVRVRADLPLERQKGVELCQAEADLLESVSDGAALLLRVPLVPVRFIPEAGELQRQAVERQRRGEAVGPGPARPKTEKLTRPRGYLYLLLTARLQMPREVPPSKPTTQPSPWESGVLRPSGYGVRRNAPESDRPATQPAPGTAPDAEGGDRELEPRPGIWSEGPDPDGDDDGMERSGVVLDAEGKPVADARVFVVHSMSRVHVVDGDGGGAPRPRGRGPFKQRFVETDENGVFTFHAPYEWHAVFVWHESGYAFATQKRFAASNKLRLQPWARVEGTVHIGNKPAAGEEVELRYRLRPYALPEPTGPKAVQERVVIYFSCRAKADGEGRFVLTHAPAGKVWIGRSLDMGDGRPDGAQSHAVQVKLEHGKTGRVRIGGTGRPVVGQLVVPAGTNRKVHFKKMRVWLYPKPSDEAPPAQQPAYVAKLDADGRFRVVDVPPGIYQLSSISPSRWMLGRWVQLGGPRIAPVVARHEFIMQPIPGGRSDEPRNLGRIDLTVYPYLGKGQLAPPLEARTFDGKPLKLDDYRGQFVILHFWSAEPDRLDNQTSLLQEIHRRIGGNNARLAIISVNMDASPERAKTIVARHKLNWTHAHLGHPDATTIDEQFGVTRLPTVMLIDPDGRLVGHTLHGGLSREAIARALGGAG